MVFWMPALMMSQEWPVCSVAFFMQGRVSPQSQGTADGIRLNKLCSNCWHMYLLSVLCFFSILDLMFFLAVETRFAQADPRESLHQIARNHLELHGRICGRRRVGPAYLWGFEAGLQSRWRLSWTFWRGSRTQRRWSVVWEALLKTTRRLSSFEGRRRLYRNFP